MNVNGQAASRDPCSGVQVPRSFPLALTVMKRKVHQPTEKEIKLPREKYHDLFHLQLSGHGHGVRQLVFLTQVLIPQPVKLSRWRPKDKDVMCTGCT